MTVNADAPVYLTSPDAALARVASEENALLTAADRALADFLGKIVSMAEGGSLTRGGVLGAWRASITSVLTAPTFALVRNDLLGELDDLTFADDAYDAAALVLSVTHDMGATRPERDAMLETVFSLPDEPPSLVSSLSAKVDAWLRRRVSQQLLARIRRNGAADLENPTFPEYPTAPHATGTIVTEADWREQDERPGDINWRARMQRDIRTAYTRVYGRQMVRQIARYGYTRKRWVSREDDRVRHTHAIADGQTVGVHDHFHVGASFMAYPGDKTAPPGEVINCRCALVAVP